MLTVTYNGMEYQCATAYKGEDSVRLVDENGVLVADFEGVCDFSAFTCIDAAGNNDCWTTCPSENECYPVVVGADGKLKKSATELFKVATVLDWYDALAAGPEAADMPSTWMDLGPGIAYIDEGRLRNQPCDKGFLINLSHRRTNDQRLPAIGQLLFRTDYNEPCRVWMRRNLTTKSSDPTSATVASTTTWDNDEQWVQILDENYQRGTIKLVKNTDVTFDALDSFSIFSTSSSTDVECQSGNLTFEQRDNVQNWDNSGSSINHVAGVLIGEGIKRVRVTLTARYVCNFTGTTNKISINSSIFKVSTDDTKTVEAVAQDRLEANGGTSQIVSTLIDVTPGDFIFARSYKSNTTYEMSLMSANKATQMIVEAIG